MNAGSQMSVAEVSRVVLQRAITDRLEPPSYCCCSFSLFSQAIDVMEQDVDPEVDLTSCRFHLIAVATNASSSTTADVGVAVAAVATAMP